MILYLSFASVDCPVRDTSCPTARSVESPYLRNLYGA
jgi:hypothetical protein